MRPAAAWDGYHREHNEWNLFSLQTKYSYSKRKTLKAHIKTISNSRNKSHGNDSANASPHINPKPARRVTCNLLPRKPPATPPKPAERLLGLRGRFLNLYCTLSCLLLMVLSLSMLRLFSRLSEDVVWIHWGEIFCSGRIPLLLETFNFFLRLIISLVRRDVRGTDPQFPQFL